MGALPYEAEPSIIRMMTKLFADIPYLPLLPKMEPNKTLFYRTLDKVPGIVFQGKIFPFILCRCGNDPCRDSRFLRYRSTVINIGIVAEYNKEEVTLFQV